MKLSTKARYGMRAMIDLALHCGDRPVLLKEIAKRQEVSMKYLDHIISALKAQGLVKNVKMKHGGYMLTKPPSKIKAYDVVRAVEGPLTPVECVDDPKICERSSFCVTIDLWRQIKESIIAVLQRTTF